MKTFRVFKLSTANNGCLIPLFFERVCGMRQFDITYSAKQVERASGRSSVAAAAYRTASILHDERTGLTHDYTKKQGVEHSQIYLPDNAPASLHEAETQHELRQKLWNAAEEKENRKNSVTAREFIVTFPHEFNAMQRREAGDAMSRAIMERFGCAVEIAYHRPTGDDNKHNFHAHIMYSTRGFDEQRPDGWERTKYRDMNKGMVTTPDGEKAVQSAVTIMELKAHAAGEMNRIAERDKLSVVTHHLSFKERGIDREPTQHRGPTAEDMERRGKRSERGDINRAIQAANDNRDDIKEQLNVISLDEARRRRAATEKLYKSQQDIKEQLLYAAASHHRHFEFHDKQVSRSQDELDEARERLENITLVQRITGKRAELLEDIEAKEKNLDDAKMKLANLVNTRTREAIEQGWHSSDARYNEAGEIRAQEAAEREQALQQYDREQKELKAIESQLASRTNGDRIIGAITGRTREQKARIDELRESVKSYEAEQRQREYFQATTKRENLELAEKQKAERVTRDARAVTQRYADDMGARVQFGAISASPAPQSRSNDDEKPDHEREDRAAAERLAEAKEQYEDSGREQEAPEIDTEQSRDIDD